MMESDVKMTDHSAFIKVQIDINRGQKKIMKYTFKKTICITLIKLYIRNQRI